MQAYKTEIEFVMKYNFLNFKTIFDDFFYFSKMIQQITARRKNLILGIWTIHYVGRLGKQSLYK